MRKRYLALAIAIFIVGLSSIAMSEEATLSQENRYAPSRLGMPDAISGYSVLAVLTEDNYVCMKPGEKRLVLQSPQLTIEDGPRDYPKELIEQRLQASQPSRICAMGINRCWPRRQPGTAHTRV